MNVTSVTLSQCPSVVLPCDECDQRHTLTNSELCPSVVLLSDDMTSVTLSQCPSVVLPCDDVTSVTLSLTFLYGPELCWC